LPVLGVYDVVIVGGGTSGAAAGIGASRQGCSVLVAEYLHGLGGTGLKTLIAAVEASPALGDGYEYRGMGHDHSRGRMSKIDSLILAMGYAGAQRAIPAILNKLKLLDVDKPFPHHYAIAVALETIRDPVAAEPLADPLSKPGMNGHAIQTLEEAIRREETPLGNASRRSSFREIVLSRALFRCGDRDGLGRNILRICADTLPDMLVQFWHPISSST
jgi:hypothetical protein